MLKTLPFGALRTLEAVVRLRGFSRAAEELNVTQSAVSQHVKQLEEWLGLPLLLRHGRSVVPTQAGAELARATQQSFDPLAELCEALRQQSRTAPQNILVACPPGFGFLWLLPRLLRFADRFPDYNVDLSTDPQSRNPLASDADIIIQYGQRPERTPGAEELMAEEMTPVCAPSVAAQLRDVRDLAAQVILLDRLDDGSSHTNWEHWAQGSGHVLPHFAKTRTLGQANLVIQAVIHGHGVAMGRSPLVADAVANGQLVAPFADSVRAPNSYWVSCRPQSRGHRPVTQFLDWLRTQT